MGRVIAVGRALNVDVAVRGVPNVGVVSTFMSTPSVVEEYDSASSENMVPP